MSKILEKIEELERMLEELKSCCDKYKHRDKIKMMRVENKLHEIVKNTLKHNNDKS